MFLLRSSALVILAVAIAVAAASNTKEEQQMVNLINEIDQQESFPLFGGLSVERVEGARSFGGDASEDLAERAVRYLNTHSVKFNVPEEEGEGRRMEEARSSRLKKVFLPLLLALKLKMSVVLPILLTIIKLISLKGLIAGLLALKFSIFTFLKDLFNKKQERVTTAYITSAQPVNAEIVHQDWHRNGQASPQELAYGAYNPYATLQ
ncbi:AAEL002949-PA [Aedes aegypti]|uniref:AAEL002949-PA n=1 Tax=Aedes aegypti TaxID=7159 RepID=Q17GL9_AEDAE|nr:AAEL002949-PA [Aedes aegypti]